MLQAAINWFLALKRYTISKYSSKSPYMPKDPFLSNFHVSTFIQLISSAWSLFHVSVYHSTSFGGAAIIFDSHTSSLLIGPYLTEWLLMIICCSVIFIVQLVCWGSHQHAIAFLIFHTMDWLYGTRDEDPIWI